MSEANKLGAGNLSGNARARNACAITLNSAPKQKWFTNKTTKQKKQPKPTSLKG